MSEASKTAAGRAAVDPDLLGGSCQIFGMRRGITLKVNHPLTRVSDS